jgi:hypothetical protein
VGFTRAGTGTAAAGSRDLRSSDQRASAAIGPAAHDQG